MQPIYLDHNATTPPRPEVVEVMAELQAAGHANPASEHGPGREAKRILEEARHGIAGILGAKLDGPRPDRLIFTSGGTEANNLAVLGLARGRSDGVASQVVISSIEHSSVIGPAEHLLEAHGWRLDTLGVTPDGVVQVDRLENLLSERTGVVSVTAANHEIGTIQPIGELAAICNRAGVALHTDATQLAGKLPIDFHELGVAALSLAAHKFHGPLGIGALLVRGDVDLAALHFGGHQQWGIRPGTESVALAMGMWTALRLWRDEGDGLFRQMNDLRDQFESNLLAAWPGLIVHGACASRLPQTTNIAFPDMDGDELFAALDSAGVICSRGAACTSGSDEVSPTLRALGLPGSIAESSFRFSLGHTTTEGQICEATERILSVCSRLQGM